MQLFYAQIGRVSAEDKDSEQYNSFEYKLQSTSMSELFSVDSHTGEITTRTSLDREEHSLHQFHIVAYDRKAPTMSSTALVSVQVWPSVYLELVLKGIGRNGFPGVEGEPITGVWALGAESPAESRGTAPGQEVKGFATLELKGFQQRNVQKKRHFWPFLGVFVTWENHYNHRFKDGRDH